MIGSWWELLVGIIAALVLTWLALILMLAYVRPRGGLLSEALRILPDVVRLIHRPTRVIRRSSCSLWIARGGAIVGKAEIIEVTNRSWASSEARWCMVRNFNTVNGTPPRPIRCWRNRTGPRVVRRTSST